MEGGDMGNVITVRILAEAQVKVPKIPTDKIKQLVRRLGAHGVGESQLLNLVEGAITKAFLEGAEFALQNQAVWKGLDNEKKARVAYQTLQDE